MKNFFKYTLLFVIVVLLQVLLFNNMNLFGLVNIYIYLIFLISLPVGMSRDLQMVLAFLLGLCVDVFTNTLGMNIFASVLVAFVRNSLLGRLYNRQELEASVSPSIKTIGRPAFRFFHCLVAPYRIILFGRPGIQECRSYVANDIVQRSGILFVHSVLLSVEEKLNGLRT